MFHNCRYVLREIFTIRIVCRGTILSRRINQVLRSMRRGKPVSLSFSLAGKYSRQCGIVNIHTHIYRDGPLFLSFLFSSQHYLNGTKASLNFTRSFLETLNFFLRIHLLTLIFLICNKKKTKYPL